MQDLRIGRVVTVMSESPATTGCSSMDRRAGLRAGPRRVPIWLYDARIFIAMVCYDAQHQFRTIEAEFVAAYCENHLLKKK